MRFSFHFKLNKIYSYYSCYNFINKPIFFVLVCRQGITYSQPHHTTKCSSVLTDEHLKSLSQLALPSFSPPIAWVEFNWSNGKRKKQSTYYLVSRLLVYPPNCGVMCMTNSSLLPSCWNNTVSFDICASPQGPQGMQKTPQVYTFGQENWNIFSLST